MTVEYLPVGIACNIACGYCYQDPMRKAGNINVPRDWPNVRAQLDRLGSEFSLFGGEPLLAPMAHLEEVFAYGVERFGKNGIQTNGSLITEAHLDLFARYKVHVGISIDGPPDLNLVRCAPELTARTQDAIAKLCARGTPPSIIVTIHRGNADLSVLVPWLNDLVAQGVRSINFHDMEVDCGQDALALPEAELIQTFLGLYEWSSTVPIGVVPFKDIRALLTEPNPAVLCVWNACDPLTTPAVQGISAAGAMSNCGRTNKDGVNWVKADRPGHERTVALYHTPQADGGCQGCRYFLFCKGQCPGTAIDGDWRNRTVNCRLWYALYDRIERDCDPRTLLSSCAKRRLEQRLLSNVPGTGDHMDVPHGDGHGDSWHGDQPHGDGHDDHLDTQWRRVDHADAEGEEFPAVWVEAPLDA